MDQVVGRFMGKEMRYVRIAVAIVFSREYAGLQVKMELN